MREIDRKEVKEIIDSTDNEIIVEVLSEEQFTKAHLPDAINVPLGDGFDERIQKAIPDKSRTVIVYCQNLDCPASPKAAKRMDALGYENVLDYAAGKDDWSAADLPMIKHPNT
ncbi:rhodanese-like domain-containing protein [Stappia sp. F7233]|uniref:Rhodanese-like domain-containing protein n=1 Tax=Stappia albiluteola TaxID=2758565 RepID=A0A839ACR5_9HYPH|nr:rhodanese-like domain-containing protein [Stappia albiluteola]MBA5777540.1 rhodanese-like domain-containing protein [Stappia albiluteola]